MKAIIETGGKQYLVEEGKVLYIEKLDAKEGEKVVFENILMAGDTVGTPYVKGAKVSAKVEKQGKSKKVIVYKYRAKKNYHKKQGHRQPYTKVTIEKIECK